MSNMELWYTENQTNNVNFSMKVKSHLYSKQSDFQKIDIIDTYEFGKVLVIDTWTMVTDERVYADIQILMRFFGMLIGYVSYAKDIRLNIEGKDMIKECHRHIQGIDIRQREVGGWRDNEEFKINNSSELYI